MKVSARILFTLFVVGLFVWEVLGALDWGFRAKIFPMAIGIPAIGLGILQLVFDITEATGRREEKKGHTADLEFEKDVDPVTARNRALATIAWIVAFLVAIELLGIYVSSVLFVFLYLKVQARERWVISVVMTLGSGFFIYGLFDRLLHVPFPPGVLLDLVR